MSQVYDPTVSAYDCLKNDVTELTTCFVMLIFILIYCSTIFPPVFQQVLDCFVLFVCKLPSVLQSKSNNSLEMQFMLSEDKSCYGNGNS